MVDIEDEMWSTPRALRGRVDHDGRSDGAAAVALVRWTNELACQTMAELVAQHTAALERGDLAEARRAALRQARFVLNLGHPAWASRILDEVDDLEAQTPHEPCRGMEVAMRAVARGRIAELRGEWAQAEAIFTDAIERLDGDDDAEARDAVRLAWGTTMAMLSAESAAVVVPEMEQVRASGAGPAIARLAGIPLGLATGYLGQIDAGVALVQDALDGWDFVHEAAQVQVRLAEMLCHHGQGERAAAIIDEALEVLDEVGGSYWAARALTVLARTGTVDPCTVLARARLLSNGDVAFDLLFEREDALRIGLSGDVGVSRRGEPVTFAGRQAEFVVLALAALAPDSASLEALVAALWPSPDPRRLPQRVRTLLWQVRRALGTDAWRLGRDGDRLWLDVRGVDVVGHPLDGGNLLDGWHYVGDGPRQWLLEQVSDAESVA